MIETTPRRIVAPKRALTRVILMLLAASVGMMTGCGTYDAVYRYMPSPATRTVPSGGGEMQARIQATILGIRRKLAEIEHPHTIEVLLEIESIGTETVTLPPDSLKMITERIQSLGEPAVDSEEPLVVPAGEQGSLRAYFPLPGDVDPTSRSGLDLTNLNLRWAVEIGGRRHEQSTNFKLERRPMARPDEYIPEYHFGIRSGERQERFHEGYLRRPF